MIVRMHNSGTSFKGLAAYLTHDPKAKSEERVGWTHTLNLTHDHAGSAVDEMLWTARSAELLKQEAGVRAGGRATENTIKHVSLNWAPGETPSREHMIETSDKFLRHMNWHEHQALVVAHEDKDFAHCHLMINTVHPETGRHLDDNFDHRRAQKWALGYELESGNVRCKQRLQNSEDRERAPTRPAWMAFKDKEKDFERDEKALAENAPTVGDGIENPKVINLAEWKKVKEFQRQERQDFFAEGKSEFKELRNLITREVREEFREKWANYYSSERGETNKSLLAETKAKLVTEQKAELEARRDHGCAVLKDARSEQYKVLLEYQQETRHGLRARQGLGLDNSLFLQHMDEGTLRDRWPALTTTVSAAKTVQEMRQAAEGTTAHKAEEGASQPRPKQRAQRAEANAPSFTSGVAKGADKAADVGLSLIFLLDKMVGSASSANSNEEPQRSGPPVRNPFEGVFEDTKKRQQAEKEEADGEWRKRQRSYGD